MSLWQRIFSFFRNLFTKTPSASPAGVAVQAPAPVQAAPAPAAPAPQAPSEPPSFALIRSLIAKWRGMNLEWRTIGYNLQTMPGLARSLTDAEWEVAYAAGFPRELNAAPAPVAADPNAPDFVNGTSFDYKWSGANLVFMGGRKTKVITGVPAGAMVVVKADLRAIPATQPYTLTVNGVSVRQEMVQNATPITTTADASGEISITIDQPDDSSAFAVFYAQPQ